MHGLVKLSLAFAIPGLAGGVLIGTVGIISGAGLA